MREYLLVFLVAASMTYLLTVIAREVALRTGAVAQVRDRDMHVVPIPYFGGLAMLGGLVAAYVVARELPFLSLSAPNVFRDAGVVLVAAALICLVGVLDDLFELDALTKLGGQVLAAGFLIAFDVQYRYFPVPGEGLFVLPQEQAALLTVLTVVATVNAVNFVDGLDGLAAGVIGVGAVAFFVFCYQLAALNGVTLAVTGALLSAALGGACIGFLPHNFYPARLFMGDSGSMLLGLALAASALTLTGQFAVTDITQGGRESGASLLPTLLPIIVPLSILVVPFADLTLAVVRRTRRGEMFYHPDKQHLHHRMLEIGHSHRRAVLIIWLWAGLIGFGTVLGSLYSGPLVWGLLVAWLVLTVVLTFVVPRFRGIDPAVEPA
ncbi:glycosyltransferase family 4 protein [Nocardioides donggukensis]|uniref:Undecaprenyl/decaprenyl-phosphate alpha-N-acetylglucosaminyl 1-phosphate transferase n=1 Tax=Nocardioides donggukensis TaxID=2774019 RepID=A0A927Q273_9ACTN|nr:MraY family glycosyltransferase [Nocardioides donggukensis]MBD8870104.1 undecaprenyl/decaprenyl-phosphate alpha-N-acetylglucosaminyl 1-phosphate transferase [Nocardioides donggukensis]